MIRILPIILIVCIIFTSFPLNCFAQSDIKTGKEDKSELKGFSDIILKNKFSLQTLGGVLYSPVYGRESRPDLNYAMMDLRFIWSLNPELTVRKLNLEGNLDFIFELTYSYIFEGAGNVISGITLLFRYNFPYCTDTLFPYIQAGGGVVYNDAYKDRSQTVIGNQFEYNPQASIGVRYLIKKDWSIDFEAMFHHLSNGGSDERNTSVNAVGALIGITCYF